MTAITLGQIRQRVGQLARAWMLDPDWQTGTATGGTTTTLVDAVGLLDAARGSVYASGYLLRTAPTVVTGINMSDLVNRINSAVSPGTMDVASGMAYQAGSSYGVQTRQLYDVSDLAGDLLVITGGAVDGTFTVQQSGTINSATDYRNFAVLTRNVDANNFVEVYVDLLVNINLVIALVVGGAAPREVARVSGGAIADGTSYTLTVTANGRTISATLTSGGSQLASTSYAMGTSDAATFATATNQGLLLRKLGAPGTAARVQDLSYSNLYQYTASDRERRITTQALGGDAPTTGTLTVTPPWTGQPVVGEAYEVATLWRPTDVEAAIQRVHTRLLFEEETDIPGVSGQRQYSLAAYPWISKERYLGLRARDGSTAGAYRWDTVSSARITRDEESYTLDLGGPTYTSADTLRMLSLRPYSDLGTLDTAGSVTTLVPLDLIAWETLGELAPDNAAVWSRLRQVRRRLSPKVSRPLFEPGAERWGFSGIGW